MRPIWHFIASFILSVVVFFFTRSIAAGLIALLAGIFIDLDHLVDYWASRPKRPFSVRDFLDSERCNVQKKWLFILFHGWEWVALLIIVTWASGWNVLLAALGLSVALHLALDTYYTINEAALSRGVYFIVLRAIRGFKKKRFKNVGKSKGIS